MTRFRRWLGLNLALGMTVYGAYWEFHAYADGVEVRVEAATSPIDVVP